MQARHGLHRNLTGNFASGIFNELNRQPGAGADGVGRHRIAGGVHIECGDVDGLLRHGDVARRAHGEDLLESQMPAVSFGGDRPGADGLVIGFCMKDPAVRSAAAGALS